MEVVFFLLGLAHVLILFASAIALSVFIAKRLLRSIFRFFTAKPAAPKSAAPRQKIYTGPLTGPATVQLPRDLRR